MSRAARNVRASRLRASAVSDAAPLPLRREVVLRALDELTPEDRLVLALQLCEGLDDDETAEALGLPLRGLPFGPRATDDRSPMRSAA